jgi:benzodiazapine receptor
MRRCRMNLRNIGKLVLCLILCEGAGGIGSIFTIGAIPTWYAALQKPAFTPPNAVFAPIWFSLYLLMAVAVFLIWLRGLEDREAITSFTFFWVQLVVNVLWSVIFFGMKSPLGGVVLIIILWLLILYTIIRFFRISRVAGSLLVPYLAWVSVASYLNIGVWLLN